MKDEIIGVIPIDFFQSLSLNPFNVEELDNKAFCLRAVGISSTGARAKADDCILFTEDLAPLVPQSYLNKSTANLAGYKYIFRKASPKDNSLTTVWMVEPLNKSVNFENILSNPRLFISNTKPGSRAHIISYAENFLSQYIFIQ